MATILSAPFASLSFGEYGWTDLPPSFPETESMLNNAFPVSGDVGLDAGEYIAEAWISDGEIADAFPAVRHDSDLPTIAQLEPTIVAAAPAILQAIHSALPALRGLLSSDRDSLLLERDSGDWEVMAADIGALERALAESGFPSSLRATAVERMEPQEPSVYSEFLPAIAGIVAALAPVAVQVIQSLTSKPQPTPAAPSPAIATAPPRPPIVQPPPRPPLAPAAPQSPASPRPGSAEPALGQLQAVLPLLAQLASQLAALGSASGPTATRPSS